MFKRVCSLLVAPCFALCVILPVPVRAQANFSPRELEPLIKSQQPIYIEGERVYRPKETEKKALITYKPEPGYTEKALKKNVRGTVKIRVVLSAAGEVKVLYILKELRHGLTEEALKVAKRIKFEPAMVGGKAVSVIVILEYNFNARG